MAPHNSETVPFLPQTSHGIRAPMLSHPLRSEGVDFPQLHWLPAPVNIATPHSSASSSFYWPSSSSSTPPSSLSSHSPPSSSSAPSSAHASLPMLPLRCQLPCLLLPTHLPVQLHLHPPNIILSRRGPPNPPLLLPFIIWYYLPTTRCLSVASHIPRPWPRSWWRPRWPRPRRH